MSEFISDFDDKVAEINKYFNFVWLIDNLKRIDNLNSISPKSICEADNTTPRYELKDILDSVNSYKIDSELVKILKANCYLILYNLVEGAITSGINALFVAFSSKRKPYKDFKKEIQQIWIKYKKYTHETFETSKINESAKFFVDTLNNIFNEEIEISQKEIGTERRIVVHYESYLYEIGQSNEISGNLDARKIRELSKLYGFQENVKESNSLLIVKNKRNSLAHGRSTFSEEGRQISIEELILMKDDVITYLRDVLALFDNHIRNENYLKN